MHDGKRPGFWGNPPDWPRLLFWLILAVPGFWMIRELVNGVLPMKLYHASGELSTRLLILALLPGPLSDFFGRNRFLRIWLSARRNLGVAAFAYALLHLVIYWLDMKHVSAMLDELSLPAIWTGWLAFVAMLVPASISFDAAMRRLRKRWKKLQYFVYPALVFALVHWLMLGWSWQPATAHLLPLLIAWTLRMLARSGSHMKRKMT